MIADDLFAQVDDQGNQKVLIDDVVDQLIKEASFQPKTIFSVSFNPT
jgi:hypothetical protein